MQSGNNCFKNSNLIHINKMYYFICNYETSYVIKEISHFDQSVLSTYTTIQNSFDDKQKH